MNPGCVARRPVWRAAMGWLVCWAFGAGLGDFAWTARVTAAAVGSAPATFEVGAVDAYLAGEVRRKGRVGISVAIVLDGRVVLAKGYGHRRLEPRGPVEVDTQFAIGSVTKQFTCAAVLLLAEEGKLAVTDTVAKWYPELTRAGEITLLDLMSHTSGYPDYYPLDYVDGRMRTEVTADEVIGRYGKGRLDFDPGTKYSYSNTGYLILGRVVEKVSGRSFGDYLEDRLFRRAGMQRTQYEPVDRDEGRASGYGGFAMSDPEPLEPEASGWIGAAGGIYSTPSDLVKWNEALHGGRVLSAESYRVMTTARELSNGRVTTYGCGLGVRIQQGRRVLVHTGAVSGFNCYNATVPSLGMQVVVMANADGGVGDLGQVLLGLLLQEKQAVPEVKGPPAKEMAVMLFGELRSGRVRRDRYSDDFNVYLTESRVRGAANRLRRFGNPREVTVVQVGERGGMEVSVCRLTFRSGALRTLMYRRPDGVVEQFFVDPD